MNQAQDLKEFKIPNTISFEKSDSGLTKIIITNELAEAEIYLHGGHLTHFQPNDERPLIFDSKKSLVSPPRSVHAGIPICWPWFGPHPTDSSKPQHGFARDKLWTLKSTKRLDSKATEVILLLKDDNATRALFPYAFELELTFTIGTTLEIKLTTINQAQTSFTITQALHTYFAINDIDTIKITGVETTPFIDYTDKKIEKREEASLEINKEVNRVYVPTGATSYIIDKDLERTIVIEKSGSDSTTIWNPWRESGIHDLPGTKYREFVCVETTNALQDAQVVNTGTSHTITQKISVLKV